MSNRRLRAVAENEKPLASVPKSLADAVGMGRREFLVHARLEIAKTVDAGVPAHALRGLIAEMNSLDAEIRRFDAQAAEEESGVSVAEDGSFDAAAI